MLNIITIKDTEENEKEMQEAIDASMKIIDLYPEIFPHLVGQGFKLKKRFDSGTVVLQEGVIITFSKYRSNGRISNNAKRKIQSVGDESASQFVRKKNGDYIIHQIASDRTKKDAAYKVLNEFIEWCKSNHAENIWLTVRAENKRALQFYEKNGFVKEGDIHWQKKVNKKIEIIPGIVYKNKIVADKNIETVSE